MPVTYKPSSAKEMTPLGVDEIQRSSCSDQSKTVNDHVSLVIQKSSVIERVPEILRQNKENVNCFTPLLIALGAYHHGKEERTWKRGEELKIQLVREFYKDKPSSSCVPDYKKVEAVGSEARNCYTEESTKDINDEDFANMMFHDGCAVLQFISCAVNGNWGQMNIKNYEKSLIVHDLFLLENQLPFIVLKQLMCENEVKDMFYKFINRIRPDRNVKAPWGKKIADFFYKVLKGDKNKPNQTEPDGEDQSRQNKPNEDGQPLHLLDSLWKFYVQLADQPPEETINYNDWYTFRSTKELKAAGILFSPSETHRFTDVKYKPLPLLHVSYLCLPPIIVDDSTKSFLLNLASYEMSSPTHPDNHPVSSYICFMDSLVDHVEDVVELRRSGIILNRLGSDGQVAGLFNDVAKHLLPDRDAFRYVKKHIEDHYSNRAKVWITEWVYTHFRSPWTILAFIAAMFGLAMTFMQTYIAFKEFPNKLKK